MIVFAGDPPNLKEIKYFDVLFCRTFSLTKPWCLSEIGDLSCITSCWSCLVFSWIS